MSTAENLTWDRVTPQHPCQFCGKAGERCAVSRCRRYGICYRHNAGGGVEKRDQAGSVYWSYVLEGYQAGGERPELRVVEAPESIRRAEPEMLDRVYSAMLSSPETELTAKNREALLARGFTDDDLARLRYRSHPGRSSWKLARAMERKFDEKTILSVPGFFMKAGRDGEMLPSMAGRSGLLIPIRDLEGRAQALSNRPDEIPNQGGGKYFWLSSKSEAKGNGPSPGSPAHVPLGIKRPAPVVRLTEGALKADLAQALSGIPTIGLAGLGWKPAIPILHRLGATTARLAFDSDWRSNQKVALALHDFIVALQKAGLVVEIETWDPLLGKGIDDLLAAGHQPSVVTGEQAIALHRAIAEAAGIVEEKPAPSSGERLPIILTGSASMDDGLKKWSQQGLDAVAAKNRNPPMLFQRGRALTRIREDDEVGGIFLESHNVDSFRGVLDRAAYWGSPYVNRKGEVKTNFGPPRLDVVRDIMAMPGWNHDAIPPLDLIIECPRFLPDGRLITEPGYHRAGALYYKCPPCLAGLRIPERPNRKQIEAAKKLLLDDLLVDFPFVSQASRANSVAFALLFFVRALIDGQTPFHMFGSSTEGTGKGFLANACSTAAVGWGMASTTQKESEAEWRKALTSLFKSGRAYFYLDNLFNPKSWDGTLMPFDSGTLASALTQPTWNDRLLHTQDEPTFRINTIFCGSGNNVEWSRELARRIVPIDILPASENPSERTGFKHDPIDGPEGWANQNRRALVEACLIICRHWIAEGMPKGSERFNSYQSYATAMGGILGSVGIEGFLANRRQVSVRDREAERWPALVEAWYTSNGRMATSSANVYEMIYGRVEGGVRVGGNPDLQVAFSDVVGDGKELSQKQKLGHAIGKQDGRVWGNHRVVKLQVKTHNGSPLYRLLDPTETYEVDDSTEDNA